MRNGQFLDSTSYKVVNCLLSSIDTPNVDVDYMEENTDDGQPEKAVELEKPVVSNLESIGGIAGRGILKDYDNGTFGSSKQVTRA